MKTNLVFVMMSFDIYCSSSATQLLQRDIWYKTHLNLDDMGSSAQRNNLNSQLYTKWHFYLQSFHFGMMEPNLGIK